jgi:hypothetical protein
VDVDCSSIAVVVGDGPITDVAVNSPFTVVVDSKFTVVVGASPRSRSGLFVHADTASTATSARHDQRLERTTAPAS